MGRPRKPTDEYSETETNSQGKDGEPAVKDLPPANPLGEPVHDVDSYSDGDGAELTQGTIKPNETIVEHPLSPTDSNPNPHGQRSQPNGVIWETDPDTKAARRVSPDEDEGALVEIENTTDRELHLGDERIIGKGERMKVSKDLLKDENMKGKFKRV